VGGEEEVCDEEFVGRGRGMARDVGREVLCHSSGWFMLPMCDFKWGEVLLPMVGTVDRS
jgi:hypothetical protein